MRVTYTTKNGEVKTFKPKCTANHYTISKEEFDALNPADDTKYVADIGLYNHSMLAHVFVRGAERPKFITVFGKDYSAAAH